MTGEHMCLVRGHGRDRAPVLMPHLRVVTFESGAESLGGNLEISRDGGTSAFIKNPS